MHNPWDPSPDEIRAWAYTPNAQEPCQDWDLALTWSRHEKALLDCVADDACPGRHYMLRVLYLIVGDAVRSGFASTPRPAIEGLIARGDAYAHIDIRLWQTRSRELLKRPETFEYHAWCGGGLVDASS